jgi:hypothetical protein
LVFSLVQVKDGIKKKIQDARFIAVSCDEVTTVDHGSYVSIHAYIMENWTKVPLLIACKQVLGGATANNLTKVISTALEDAGGMDKIANRTKLISFGANGVSVFQGCRTGVATQLKMKHAPFLISVHCFAHRLNLAYKSLSSMGVMPGIESLLSSTYGYFAHSPKKVLEFQNSFMCYNILVYYFQSHLTMVVVASRIAWSRCWTPTPCWGWLLSSRSLRRWMC